jgi:uncharacterized tellurite resistance protein B-like protein
MTNAQAAYTLLTMLSVIDGKISPEEQSIIQEYSTSRYGEDIDIQQMDKELLGMAPNDLLERFQQAALDFYENTQPEERRDLLDQSLSLVMADGSISDEEMNVFQGLSNVWGISVDDIIQNKEASNA